jgi:RNA polymerase sigma-70 factor (ECF subfamily)
MLKDLPARQRAAILLAANGERSNAEISAALGLSVGAVEQLLVRARRTLRTRLAQFEAAAESEGR